MAMGRVVSVLSIDFQDRVVIVAGAGGGGIGTATVHRIAEAGATVVAVDISRESLDRSVVPLAANGLSIVPCVADVETEEGVEAVMNVVRAVPGALHGLVTVVGGARAAQWKSALEVSRADWHALQSWNLTSMFFMTQAVAAELRAQKRSGSLVAISSISGIGAAPFHVSYGAAKAAILSLVRSLAIELAVTGIRVNAIAPGAVGAPGSLVSQDSAALRSAVPIGRVGEPGDVANIALFLLSELSSYMTGQCLVADGGTSLRWSHLDDDNMPKLISDAGFRERILGGAG